MKRRYIFTFLAFLGNMFNLFGRDSLRIGILAIREEYETCIQNSTECGTVDWNDHSVATVLSSFNYGMVGTMLVGGFLADMLGGKHLLLGVTLVSSVTTLLIPSLASVSLVGLVMSQVVYGMSGGLVVPALSSMIVRWEPLTERGRLATIIYSGSQVSAVGAAVFTGLVTQYTDWRYVFWILGSLPLLWLPAWWLLVTDSPTQSRIISQQELHLLQSETSTSTTRPSFRDIPILAILKSRPVWAVILVNMGAAWARAHTAFLMPQYLSEVLNLSLDYTGLASAAPYLACCLVAFIASIMYTYITQKKKLSTGTARKFCSSIFLCGFALFTLPLLFLPHHPLTATAFSSAAYSLYGFHLVGGWCNPQDIAPNYVATLMGLIGLAYYCVTALVPNTLTLATALLPPDWVWSGLFILVAVVSILAQLAFLFLGSGEIQPWNSIQRAKSDFSEVSTDNSSLDESVHNEKEGALSSIQWTSYKEKSPTENCPNCTDS